MPGSGEPVPLGHVVRKPRADDVVTIRVRKIKKKKKEEEALVELETTSEVSEHTADLRSDWAHGEDLFLVVKSMKVGEVCVAYSTDAPESQMRVELLRFARRDRLEYEYANEVSDKDGTNTRTVLTLDKLELVPAPAQFLTHRVTDYSNVLVRVNGKVLSYR